MKRWLFNATVAGIGFTAALGIVAMREYLWQQSAATVQEPSIQEPSIQEPPVRPATPTPAAAEPTASDPQSDGRESTESAAVVTAPMPTYEEQAAAHDRAAAHGARSR